jgi:Sap, sulfolipid-1-addressing protein
VKSDPANILVLALIASLYPTLLAAVTIMLLQPSPKRLMFGYLLGAYTTSITVGLVIVFSLQGSGLVNEAKRTISPALDVAIGLILLLVAFVLATGRDEPLQRARLRRQEAKRKAGNAKEPWSQRMLGRGSARTTYVIGVLLSFPGVTYLTALNRIARLEADTGAKVALVVGFCLVQLVLLEVPLLSYTFAPEWTRGAVTRFRGWLSRSGRRIGIVGAAGLGAVLIVRGTVGLL